MAKLPVTVTDVKQVQGGMFAVTVAFDDFTTANYLIPPTLATVEAVTMSALAMAVLSDVISGYYRHPHRKHTRFLPRP